MPSAPNLRAVSASSGVSALARTPMRRCLSAHSISVPKSPDIAGSIIATGADEHLARRAIERNDFARANMLAAGRTAPGCCSRR